MQILVSVQSPSCKPQPYHLPPRLEPVWDGKLAPGPPNKLQARGHSREEEKEKEMDAEGCDGYMCAKVSGGCTRHNQQVSGKLKSSGLLISPCRFSS